METVKLIQLPNGNTLEVTIRPGFLEKVACQFEVKNISDVSDEHIRLYLFNAFKSAIDKAENERSKKGII